MKIYREQLRAMRRDLTRPQTPDERPSCPQPEELIGLIDSSGSARKKAGLIDHIFNCPSCSREFEFLLEVKRHEKSLVQEIKRRLGEEKARRQRPFFWPRLSWKTAAAAFGLFLLGSFLLRFLLAPPENTFRNGAGIKIDLIRPLENEAVRSSPVFEWKAVPGAEYYVLEIFDQALAPFWESGRTMENRLALPADLVLKMAPGKSFFWLVTAHFPRGARVHSSLREFSLRN